MINYMDRRLQSWGRWSLARLDGQWSHVSQCRYREREPRSYGFDNVMPIDESCTETDRAIAWLSLKERRCAAIVCSTYRDHLSWSAEMRARLLSISSRTLYRDLDRAHALLQRYLNDRAAGLPLPQMQTLQKQTVSV